jgi:hypothetical protein
VALVGKTASPLGHHPDPRLDLACVADGTAWVVCLWVSDVPVAGAAGCYQEPRVVTVTFAFGVVGLVGVALAQGG